METNDEVLVRLRLPTELVDRYEKQAEDAHIPLESLMELRLEQTVEANDNRPIYFSDLQRRELDMLMGINLTSADQVVDRVRRALSIKIHDGKNPHTISLKPGLVNRLRSRCFEKSFPAFLKRTVLEGLESFVGWR